MKITSEPETHECSVCLKKANLVCKACKGTQDGVGGLVAVYYCDATCQKDGWKAHKPLCKAAKDRMALYRTGEIAQHLYYTFKRHAWKWVIERVEKKDNTWLVFDGIFRDKSIVVPFPDAMFRDAKDQEIIMSYTSCNSAVAFLHRLFGDTLNGKSGPVHEESATCSNTDMTTDMYSKVDEVTVRVKNNKLQIVWIGHQRVDARTYLHNVLRVTLNNDEVYALDITGAQFGWRGSTVMPWSTFLENRVDIVKEVRKFGETARIEKAEAQLAGEYRISIHHINEHIEIHLHDFLRHWQMGNASLSSMLRCSAEDFKPKQDSLLRFMEDCMLHIKDSALQTGFFDIFKGKVGRQLVSI